MFAKTEIGRHMGRTTRNLIVINALFVIFCFSSIALYASQMGEASKAPQLLKDADLAKIKGDPSDDFRFVKVSGKSISESIFEEYEVKKSRFTGKEKGRSKLAEYQLLLVDDHVVLVKVHQVLDKPVVVGRLVPLPDDVPQLTDDPELKGKLLPFMLDSTDLPVTPGDLTTGMWVLGLFSLPFLFNVWRGVKRLQNPSAHPIVKELAKLGDAEEVGNEIMKDWHQSGKPIGGCSAIITDQWLIVPGMFNVRFVKLDEIVWYHRRYTSRGNALGKELRLIVYTSDQRDVGIKVNPKALDTLAKLLGTRVPWALRGHDEELEKAWYRTPEEVIAQVLESRAEMMQESDAHQEGQAAEAMPQHQMSSQ